MGLHRALKQLKGSEIPQGEQMLSYMKHKERKRKSQFVNIDLEVATTETFANSQ